ncbi:MAG: hypothetical protein ACYSWU_28180 [Planctomycetota bacterium]
MKLGAENVVLETVRIEPVEERRKHRNLRVAVDLLIDDVRRLKGLAIDARRGFRDRDATAKEMKSIETHMIDVIKQIRAKVGLTDQELAERRMAEQNAPEESPLEPGGPTAG